MKKNKLLLIGGMVLALHLAGTALTAQAAPVLRVFVDTAGVLQVRAQPGGDNEITVVPSPGQLTHVIVGDDASTVVTEAPCEKLPGNRVACPLSKIKQIFVDTDDGNDTITHNGVGRPARLLAGRGDDRVFGSRESETIDLGPGNDTAQPGRGTDLVSGGDGTDHVLYADRPVSIVVQLDDLSNDGEPGENDNIMSDVENLTGGFGSDDLTGSNQANVIRGSGGDDRIVGLDGDDILIGDAGADRTDGGNGLDRCDAESVINCP
ncbi:calcium-binding protein [Kribbella catacumbae]|uniref:calcium-binding protein n=1 Tax=Kribbella catacumbae TaxID=460086 RepID=UPI0003690BD8|nr:calcium-binding protein [Kribbella catacumbae]